MKPIEIDELVAIVQKHTNPDRSDTLPERAHLLTLRRWVVAHLIACGYSIQEIAPGLVITEGAAANHVCQILLRLGFHSRANCGSVRIWNGARQWANPSVRLASRPSDRG